MRCVREEALPIIGYYVKMRGEDYVLGRTQMNVWFHITMAYAILRHNGVPLGKADFTR